MSLVAQPNGQAPPLKNQQEIDHLNP